MIPLSAALSDVHPFHRYEIELRAGHLRDQPLEAACPTDRDVTSFGRDGQGEVGSFLAAR